MPAQPGYKRVYHRTGGDLKVKRAEQDASDINVIMRRWRADGVVPVTGASPRYGDFSAGLDYHEGLMAIEAAQRDFMLLNSDVRKRVNNDPGQFLDLVEEPEGLKELLALGLDPGQAPGAVTDTVTSDPAAPEASADPIIGGE